MSGAALIGISARSSAVRADITCMSACTPQWNNR